jgi:hypothetical protein
MKTVNGAPQFDFDPKGIDIGTANIQLREWDESRRCVKCKFFYNDIESKSYDYCKSLSEFFKHIEKDPQTFSCAAFEEKE